MAVYRLIWQDTVECGNMMQRHFFPTVPTLTSYYLWNLQKSLIQVLIFFQDTKFFVNSNMPRVIPKFATPVGTSSQIDKMIQVSATLHSSLCSLPTTSTGTWESPLWLMQSNLFWRCKKSLRGEASGLGWSTFEILTLLHQAEPHQVPSIRLLLPLTVWNFEFCSKIITTVVLNSLLI